MEKLVLVKKVSANRSLYLLNGSYAVKVDYSKDDIESVLIEAEDWSIRLHDDGFGKFGIYPHEGDRTKESWYYSYKQFADRIDGLREMWRVLDIVALELGISF